MRAFVLAPLAASVFALRLLSSASPTTRPLSFDLKTSPTFLTKTAESIVHAENQLWNVTGQTLGQILQVVDVALIDTLDSAVQLLGGTMGHPILGISGGTNKTLLTAENGTARTLSGAMASVPTTTSSSSMRSGQNDTFLAFATLPASNGGNQFTKASSAIFPSSASSCTDSPPYFPTSTRMRSRSRAHCGTSRDTNPVNITVDVDKRDPSFSRISHGLSDLSLDGALGLESSSSFSNVVQVNASADVRANATAGVDAEAALMSVLGSISGLTSGAVGMAEGSANGTENSVGGKAESVEIEMAAALGGGSSGGGASGSARRVPGDLEWYIELAIGTPPQPILILPDTGSSDLLIFSSTCADISTENHTLYTSETSRTYSNMTIFWDGGYADGTGGSGWISSETVPATVTSDEDQGISDLLFALVSDVVGGSFDDSVPVGVLGLGQDALCTFGAICDRANTAGTGITLFSRLVKANLVVHPILSIKLVKSVAIAGDYLEDTLDASSAELGLGDPSTDAGYFLFGEIKEEHVIGGSQGLTWIPVTSHYYWGSTFDSVYMGPISVSSWTTETTSRFIVDTGTTLIFTSYELAFYIHAFIPGSQLDDDTGVFYIPCSSMFPAAPNLFVELGGQRFGVPVSDLAWRESSDSRRTGQCISGVQGGMSSFTVLGDMFLKNHYVVLSYGEAGGHGLEIGVGNRADVQPVL